METVKTSDLVHKIKDRYPVNLIIETEDDNGFVVQYNAQDIAGVAAFDFFLCQIVPDDQYTVLNLPAESDIIVRRSILKWSALN